MKQALITEWVALIVSISASCGWRWSDEALQRAARSFADSGEDPRSFFDGQTDREIAATVFSSLSEIESELDDERRAAERNALYDLALDTASSIAEAIEGELRCSSSSLSCYVGGEGVRVRVSDHDPRPTYETMFGSADLDIAVGRDRAMAALTVRSAADIPAAVAAARRLVGGKQL